LRGYAKKKAHCDAGSGVGSGLRVDLRDQVFELDDALKLLETAVENCKPLLEAERVNEFETGGVRV
jgi:hypothetical protein